MKRNKTKILTPENLVAYSAIIVGICALVVSIYEANIFRQQQKASVWPYLEFSYSNVDGFTSVLTNKGVGPAIIKWVGVTLDGVPVKSWDEIMEKMPARDSISYRYVSSFLSGRVVSANEAFNVISFRDQAAANNVMMNLNRLGFEICYASIFDDYWILKMDSSGSRLEAIEEGFAPPEIEFQN